MATGETAESKRKPVDKGKLELVDFAAAWIRPIEDNPLYTADIQECLTFFLMYTPCKGTSARGVLLTAYGWSSDLPEKGGILHGLLCGAAGLKKGDNLFTGQKREGEKALFLQAGMGPDFAEKCSANRVAYISSGNNTLDLFKTIRNAIAHCRFEVLDRADGCYIALENGVAASGSSFEVKARLFLKAQTLKDWVEIIKTGATAEKRIRAEKEKEAQEKQDKLIQQAVSNIAAGTVKTGNQLGEILGVSKNETHKVISTLKERKLVSYSRKKRCWVAGDADAAD